MSPTADAIRGALRRLAKTGEKPGAALFEGSPPEFQEEFEEVADKQRGLSALERSPMTEEWIRALTDRGIVPQPNGDEPSLSCESETPSTSQRAPRTPSASGRSPRRLEDRPENPPISSCLEPDSPTVAAGQHPRPTKGFAMVPGELIAFMRESRLRTTDILVLLSLLERLNWSARKQRGLRATFLSSKAIAARLGIKEPKIREARARLVDHGLFRHATEGERAIVLDGKRDRGRPPSVLILQAPDRWKTTSRVGGFSSPRGDENE